MDEGDNILYMRKEMITRISRVLQSESNYLRYRGWKVVMFSPISVCLSDCLCVGYLKILWMDLKEIWWRGRVCDKDELF